MTIIGHDNMNTHALAELETLLASDRVRPGCLKNLSTLDGFLAAIVAGPAWISPEKWLPRVFGAGDPDWSDPDEAERICDAILTHYEQIVRQLEETADSYVPVFRTLHDGSVVTVDWARGFRIGVEMRSRLWDKLTASPKGNRYFITIFSQLPDWDQKVMASVGRDAVLNFRRQGQVFIPYSVTEIWRFWAEHHDSRRASSETAGRFMVN